jgi:hypothetical protein
MLNKLLLLLLLLHAASNVYTRRGDGRMRKGWGATQAESGAKRDIIRFVSSC